MQFSWPVLFAAILLFGFAVLNSSCSQDTPDVAYDPTPYPLTLGQAPPPVIPADNKPTVEGVKLGRKLFYEKRLSGDNTLSCAGCHKQQDAFSDIRPFSIGIDQTAGRRQAMALFNLAWHDRGMFWDGRSPNLRDQALRPIQDPVEMHAMLPTVVAKLQEDQAYLDQFIRAFGDELITPARIGLAIEQFEFTLISNQSQYDRFLEGKITLSESEERGRLLFFADIDPMAGKKGAECAHCHHGFNFTDNAYTNNGLDTDAEFSDLGRFEVTGANEDRARFKVPSLRNIALTAPYMHDGRFATLAEVVDHYDHDVKASSTLDVVLDRSLGFGGLHLSRQDKEDLVAFLKTLTDLNLITDTRYADPF